VGARIANLALGFWLFVSAFLWPHLPSQRASAWIVGIVVVFGSMAGLSGQRWGRHLSAAAGGCLIVSSLVPHIHRLTFWNHMLVGLLVVLLGVSPSLADLRRRRPVAP
jgi:hypothetical protein